MIASHFGAAAEYAIPALVFQAFIMVLQVLVWTTRWNAVYGGIQHVTMLTGMHHTATRVRWVVECQAGLVGGGSMVCIYRKAEILLSCVNDQ